MGRSKGAIAALALLLGMLVGAADAPASRTGATPLPSAVGQNDAVKGGPLLRAAGRSSEDERERTGPPLPHRGAAVETAIVARRDGAGPDTAHAAPPPSSLQFPYRARAPPAAA